MDSLPLGNSITEGVLELVIYWLALPVSKLLALPPVGGPPYFFILRFMPGLLSSTVGCSSLLDLPSLLELPTWLLLTLPPIPLSLMDMGRDPSFFTPFWSAFWAWYRWLCLLGLRLLLFICSLLKFGLLFNVVSYVGRSCSMLLLPTVFPFVFGPLFGAFPPLICFLEGLNFYQLLLFSFPFY